MLKKTVEYVDYNDQKQTEDFYFNLSMSEITEMELSFEGGMHAFIKNTIESRDNKALMGQFKNLILKAYGEKSEDGRRFIKSPELSEAFSQTAAYDALFFELMSKPELSTAFFKGIMPKDLMAKAEDTPEYRQMMELIEKQPKSNTENAATTMELVETRS